jgi:hypothetical protein
MAFLYFVSPEIRFSYPDFRRYDVIPAEAGIHNQRDMNGYLYSVPNELRNFINTIPIFNGSDSFFNFYGMHGDNQSR